MAAAASVIEYALQIARAGAAAALGVALGTAPNAANATGLYADLTAAAEQVKIVAGAVDGAAFGVSSGDIRLTLQAGTRDGIRLAPRGGGSGSFVATFTTAALTASRTATLLDADQTIAGSASALTANQMVFAVSGGLLSGNAGLTFNGTTFALTVPTTTSGNLTQTGSTTWSSGTGTGSFNHSTSTFAGNVTVSGSSSKISAVSLAPTSTSGSEILANFSATAFPASDNSGNLYTVNSTAGTSASCTANFTATANPGICGISSATLHFGTGTVSLGSAGNFSLQSRVGAGAITNAHTVRAALANLGSSTLTNGGGFYSVLAINSGGGAITRCYGFASDRQTVGTNNFGFFYGSLAGTGNWCIYNNTSDANYLGAGATYIGTTAAINTDEIFQAIKSTATTNAVTPGLVLGANSTGTAAAGFGFRVRTTLESSTTDNTTAFDDEVSWVVATHASRTARRVFSVYDTAAREAMRMEASGSAPMVGFLGAAASARITFAAWTGTATRTTFATSTATLANCAEAIKAIVDDLRTFGLYG